jgi:hypothetical protein
MGKGTESTILKRSATNTEEMLNILDIKEVQIKMTEISPHSSQNGYHQ